MIKKLLAFLMVFSFVASPLAMAEGGHKAAMAGKDFDKAANEYFEKAEYFRSQGKEWRASRFSKLGWMKRKAAKLAREGRLGEMDWTEYHEIHSKLFPKGKQK